MSRGEIVEHLGECQYRIRLKFAVARVKAELAKINDRIAELAVLIPERKLDLSSAEGQVKAKVSEIDTLIPLYRDDIEAYANQMMELQSELVQLQSNVSRVRYDLDRLIAENLSLLKRRGQIERIQEDEERIVWCADYSDQLSGDVGIADINDEGSKGLLIRPGFEDSAIYDASTDGMLMPREAQSSAQVYFNAAILPGVQKWMPRYRVGIISNIVADTCTVMLNEAESSAQNLDINQARLYSGVPIQYMDCGGSVFEDGDKVLVRFFDTGPQVVGFYEEPRPCIAPGFLFSPASYTDGGFITEYGQPITEDNEPIGTASGERPAWILSPQDGSPTYKTIRGRDLQNSGMANWLGEAGIHLSWIGTGNRADVSGSYGTKVFYRLRTVVDLSDHDGFEGDSVIGAGFDGSAVFVMSCALSVTSPGNLLTLHRFPVNEKLMVNGARSTFATIELEDWQRLGTGCYWSKDGLNAVATIVSVTYDARSEPPGKYFNSRETVWKLSVSSSGSHSITEIYDSVSAYNACIVHQDSDYIGDDPGFMDPVEYDGWAEAEFSDRHVPIYVDYVGNSEITAYWVDPGGSGTSVTTGRKSIGEDAATYTKTKTDQFQYNGPGKIVTSTGQTLAEGTQTGYSEWSLFWEHVDPDHPDDTGTKSATGYGRAWSNFSENGGNGLICIDLRESIVVFAERYDDLNLSWDWSGPDDIDYRFYYIDVGTNETTWNSGVEDLYATWRVSLWVNGTKEGELVDHPAQTETVERAVANLEPTYSASVGIYGAVQAPGGTPSSVLQYGSCGFRSEYAASLLYRKFDGSTDHLARVSRIGDPASELFEQPDGAPFFLNSLTLV